MISVIKSVLVGFSLPALLPENVLIELSAPGCRLERKKHSFEDRNRFLRRSQWVVFRNACV